MCLRERRDANKLTDSSAPLTDEELDSSAPLTDEELRGLGIYYADTLREVLDALRTINNNLVTIRKSLDSIKTELKTRTNDGK
jgi:hypothetical protein